MLNIILSIVFALSGAILILLSGIIFRENPRSKINRVTSVMLFFAGTAPILATIYYAVLVPSGREYPIWLYNIFYIWELFFPSFVLFSAIFPVEHKYYKRYYRAFYAAYIPHIVHLLLVMFLADPNAILSKLTITSDFPVLGILLEFVGYFLKYIVMLFGLALEVHVRFFSIINLAYAVIASVFLHQGYRSVVNPRIQRQVKVITYGIRTAVGLYISAYIVPTIFGININPQIKYLAIIIGLLVGPGFIAWAIMRHRFLDIRLIVRQSLVYSVSSIVVVGGYLLIMGQFREILKSIFGGGVAVLEIVTMIVAVIFFQPVLNFIDGILRRLFIKGGADFKVILEGFSHKVITLLDLDELITEVLRTFNEELLIENAFLAIPSSKGQYSVYSAQSGNIQTSKQDRVLESFLLVRDLPVPRDDIPVPALSPSTRELFHEHDTELLIPLNSTHKLIGYIGLGKKASGLGYNAEDFTIFQVLANQLVIAISNARLYLESLEKQRMEEELALARQIQLQLLPKQLPSHDRFQFSVYSEPSREVGGDFYDFIVMPSEHLAVCIGDASGKGIPAALLIARMQAILHSVTRSQFEVHSKIAHINNVLSSSGMPENYVTFFYGEIDTGMMTFRYCNAGHNYPILLHGDGGCEFLIEGGLLLGAFGGVEYSSNLVQLRPGDLLTCYTDGVTEAMDDDEIEFSEKRLVELLSNNRCLPLDRLQEKVLDSIKDHCRGRPFQDDCTMMMFRVI